MNHIVNYWNYWKYMYSSISKGPMFTKLCVDKFVKFLFCTKLCTVLIYIILLYLNRRKLVKKGCKDRMLMHLLKYSTHTSHYWKITTQNNNEWIIFCLVCGIRLFKNLLLRHYGYILWNLCGKPKGFCRKRTFFLYFQFYVGPLLTRHPYLDN